MTTLTIETLGDPLARIRTIKPDFFTSLTIADLSLPARLTFIGLWTTVDDDGRAVDDSRLVKAAVWPLDDRTVVDVASDLDELAMVERPDGARGLIIRYEIGGRRYLCIRNWREHQRIDKPTKSKLPAPPDTAPEGPEGKGGSALAEASGSVPGVLAEDSRGERKGREGKGEEGKGDLPVPAVGGLTDRNARAREAPPAQPDIFIARSLIAGIPRYRAAPGWVRSKHLAPMAATVLAAGFGREAIVRYAELVIGEARFRDHQHIPEFRDALRRLGRDVELGHACATCARDPDGTWCCLPEDRPWTGDDQAALERALDQLGVSHVELAEGA